MADDNVEVILALYDLQRRNEEALVALYDLEIEVLRSQRPLKEARPSPATLA
jgi:hypothetical protein